MPDADRPIEEYALIGDCVTAALINADGGIDWLCLPAFDGPSFFGALLDREKGGDFAIRPSVPYRVKRGYVANSAIFETRFVTAEGCVKLTDFFVIARKRGVRGYDFTSLHPTRKLVRLIEMESGSEVPMEMVVRARPNYGRDYATWTRTSETGFTCGHAALFTNTGACSHGPVGRPERPTGARLQGAIPSGTDLASTWRAEPGQGYFAVLDYGDEQPTPTLADIRRWHRVTATFWEHWNYFNHYHGTHADVVRRSAVTLKLLTYAPTGAFIAAPTTSLPEIVGGESNWDYRFVWVRDSSFYINTMFRLGYSGEATGFLNFVVQQSMASEAKGGDVLPVMFPVRPETSLEEQELGHLRGWRGSQPVRIGNRAADQFQLDNAAHIVESLYCYTHTGGRIDGDKTHVIRTVAQNISKRWREPDSGLWEEQEEKLFTYGKVATWAALMRASKLAELDDLGIEETCADIRTEVLSRAVRGEGDEQHMVSRFDSDDLDAACLITFLNGFSAPLLARQTRERIERELGDGPFLFRNPEHRKKGEGAFFLCMFWRINHLVKEGDLARAEALLEETLTMLSPFGLLSEEVDPQSRHLLGNFPQAFSHLGLIGSILNVDQARSEPEMAALPDHEKFTGSVGPTVGLWAIIAGFIRAPKTLRLILSSGGSKWKG